MTSGSLDFSAQRVFIAAKIAAASAAASAEDAALAIAQRDFGEVFRAYFSVKAAEPRAQRRSLTQAQLTAAARAYNSWWLFGGAEIGLAIGFNSRLVAAAADIAICRRLTPPGETPPTPVDRSIAAALARRFAAVGAEESDPSMLPTLKKTATDLGAAFSPSDAGRWGVLSFAGAFPDEGGSFAVLIARAEPSAAASDSATADPLTPSNIAKIRDLAVTAQCFGGAFEAPLGRVLALKPGDVLPINWKGDGAAPLTLGGRPFATGTLGDYNGRRAIRL